MYPDPLSVMLAYADMILKNILNVRSGLAEASLAVDAGNATDEQLAFVTDVVHTAFDAEDGCMVGVLRGLIDEGAPHYFINHAIRTYVRVVDKREAETAAEMAESLNARYGKTAQAQE